MSGFPGCSNTRAEALLRERAATAYREIAPYEVANARAKVMLEELYAQRGNKTPEAQPSPTPAEAFLTGLARGAHRSLAFSEHVGRRTMEVFAWFRT